ncbi:YfhD family protein [Bacillus coahuilensis]|uniref:YfhD family protein n=1 Tax=Bacillus coahuilensis TaxID=408580 RepID=UPI0001850A7B|nr:YfhD family protein [Bacillus coahuilensis]
MGKKNKNNLPQTPKQLKSDGIDEEYSRELADQEDLEAQARANAANQRATAMKKVRNK